MLLNTETLCADPNITQTKITLTLLLPFKFKYIYFKQLSNIQSHTQSYHQNICLKIEFGNLKFETEQHLTSENSDILSSYLQFI